MSETFKKLLDMTAREIGMEIAVNLDKLGLAVLEKNGIPMSVAKDVLVMQDQVVPFKTREIQNIVGDVTHVRFVDQRSMTALWPQADWWMTQSLIENKVTLHFRITEESDG